MKTLKRHQCGAVIEFTYDGSLDLALLVDGRIVYDCPGCGEPDCCYKFSQWSRLEPARVGKWVDTRPVYPETALIFRDVRS